MKNLRYVSILMLVIFCGTALAVMFGNEGLKKYAADAVLKEIIPLNACVQDMDTVIIGELIPGCKVAYTEDGSGQTGYGICYEDIQIKDSTFLVEKTATDTDAEAVTEDTQALTSDAQDEGGTVETALNIINSDGIVSGPTPITYSMTQLSDFETLLSECYVVDSSTMVTEDELDAETLLSMNMGIDTSGDDIKVLIYHTHGSEAFSDSREGVVEDTIIGVGDELARILEENYGIEVYHDRNIYDNINGVIDRSNAYNLSGAAIDEILAEYPSIEVVIDLHRDGVNDEVRLVRTVDGRETAQLMFLNGVSRLKSSGDIEYLYNPHKDENLSFSLKLFLNGRSLYGDLIRKIYIRGYCFNLDRVARSSLIEVGAQTNTVEEAKNAMIPLARILNQVLSE